MIDFYCMMGIPLKKTWANFQYETIFVFSFVIQHLLMEIDKP